MSEPKHWLGRDMDAWRAMWDSADWRATVTRTLREVAQCSQAAPVDRAAALQIWSNAVTEGILPACPSYPETARDALFDIARGTGRVKPKVRKQMNERLYGAKCVLDTVATFFNRPGDRTPTAPAGLLPS